MGIRGYQNGADGSDYDENAHNDFGVALGKIPADSLNPMKRADYIVWPSGTNFYAQDGRTGVVTGNAALHTLINGLLAHNATFYFVGSSTKYALTGAINFAAYRYIDVGGAQGGTTFYPSDTINAFELDESWNIRLHDFIIDGSLQTTSGMGIKFTEATGSVYSQKNKFQRIDFNGCYQGVGDLDATTNAGADNLFEDLRFNDCTYEPINLSVNGTGFWRFHRVTIDQVGVQATGTYLMTLSNFAGIQLNNVSILTGGATSLNSFLLEDSSFIWMNDCDAEKAGQDIFRFDSCTIANINNLRASESGMDAGGGDSNIELNGCVAFNINNFTIGTSTGAASNVVNIGADGGTESHRVKFLNGSISGGAADGANISDISTYIKFDNVEFYANTSEDVTEAGTPNYNTYRNSSFRSGNGLIFLGANNVYDQVKTALSVIDLSGGATDIDIFYALVPCALVGYRLFYTEASSADVDWPAEAIRIGRTQDGVANDPDYFDETVSEASKNLGYSKHFTTAGLTNQYIATGDTVTVGTAGGKTGTGEIRVILSILENAS